MTEEIMFLWIFQDWTEVNASDTSSCSEAVSGSVQDAEASVLLCGHTVPRGYGTTDLQDQVQRLG